jgi:8-oxo-dGTP pyrophosphatase MutT (NUDIX family)
VAYAGLRGYWFIKRPHTSGVKCLLTDGGLVLLVKHTYGSRAWELPGGAVKSGEAPAATARREMQEELGLDVDSWQPLGQIELAIDHRRDVIHCFLAEVHAPTLTLDLGELSEAQWFDRAQLPRVGPYTRQILDLARDPN